MTESGKSRGIWGWQVVLLALGSSLLLYAFFFYSLGFTEEGTRACIASSAKISFTFFCLAFSASAVHRFTKNSFSFWWLMNRKYFGITFALSHLLHLSFLLVLQWVFHPVFDLAARQSLLAGGLAYFFAIAMLITSFERFKTRLTRNQWKWLHTIGGYWIWMIFLSTYSKRLLNDGMAFAPFVVILAIVLLLRIANAAWKPMKPLAIVGLLSSLCFPTNAQSYLKRLQNPDRSFRQVIERFNNGDLLIGDSAPPGSGGGMTLIRMNSCGIVIWSNAYEHNGKQLLLRDLVISEQDGIFVLGSAIDGLNEAIFLMEVNARGEELRYRMFTAPAPNISPYALDLRDGQLLAMGRLLEIGAATTGYLAIFDTQLNFQWGKVVRPFTFEGAAIITADNRYLLRTEAFHYRFDSEGQLEWSRRLDRTLDHQPVLGPIEIAGGYLFEAYFENEAFLYKLDEGGQLVWQSDLFPTADFPIAVQEVSGGKLLIHYHTLEHDLRQLELDASGNLRQNLRLESDYSFRVGAITQIVGEDGIVNILGTTNHVSSAESSLTDYLIQLSPDIFPARCFAWVDAGNIRPNERLLKFPDFETVLSDLVLTNTSSGGVDGMPLRDPFVDVCALSEDPTIIRTDSLLLCEEDWEVTLPAIDFSWEDNFPDANRLLSEPGIYRARNKDCGNPVLLEFQLERVLCDCEVTLPNAFSPNGDGQNDALRLYTSCEVILIETSVYDRWGNLVFHGQDPEKLWDGKIRKNPAKPGIYVVAINYQLLSNTGGTQIGTTTQDVLLVR